MAMYHTTIEVDGYPIDAEVELDYERPDPDVGLNGGWYVVEAVLGDMVAVVSFDDLEALIGRPAIEELEQKAAEHFWLKEDDREW